MIIEKRNSIIHSLCQRYFARQASTISFLPALQGRMHNELKTTMTHGAIERTFKVHVSDDGKCLTSTWTPCVGWKGELYTVHVFKVRHILLGSVACTERCVPMSAARSCTSCEYRWNTPCAPGAIGIKAYVIVL